MCGGCGIVSASVATSKVHGELVGTTSGFLHASDNGITKPFYLKKKIEREKKNWIFEIFWLLINLGIQQVARYRTFQVKAFCLATYFT